MIREWTAELERSEKKPLHQQTALPAVRVVAAPFNCFGVSLRAQEVFEKYPNVRLNGRRETLAVASPVDEKGSEICTAGRVIVPLLRKCVDDARIPGGERNGPRFFGQTPEPFQARGQEIIDGVCPTESRKFLGRLRTNDLRGSRLCWPSEHLEHKSFPMRIVVQVAITTRTIGRHVSPPFLTPSS